MYSSSDDEAIERIIDAIEAVPNHPNIFLHFHMQEHWIYGFNPIRLGALVYTFNTYMTKSNPNLKIDKDSTIINAIISIVSMILAVFGVCTYNMKTKVILHWSLVILEKFYQAYNLSMAIIYEDELNIIMFLFGFFNLTLVLLQYIFTLLFVICGFIIDCITNMRNNTESVHSHQETVNENQNQNQNQSSNPNQQDAGINDEVAENNASTEIETPYGSFDFTETDFAEEQA